MSMSGNLMNEGEYYFRKYFPVSTNLAPHQKRSKYLYKLSWKNHINLEPKARMQALWLRIL